MSSTAGTPASASAVERAWDSLWPQLALRDGFWLAYVFGSDLNAIRPLAERAENYARMRVRGTEVRWVIDPAELPRALAWLLDSHPPDLMLAWVVGVGGDPRQWRSAWAAFLRRLNERRDLLRRTLPAGLVLACPSDMLDLARDSAPDLWSYRSSVIVLRDEPEPRAVHAQPRVDVTRSDPHAIAERAMLRAVEPSPDVRTLLQGVAQALRADQVAAAVEAGRAALAAVGTGSSGDRALAYAWLAYPFTMYTLGSSFNDSLVALLIVCGLLVLASAPARGVASALAGLSKFGPLILAPLFAAGHGDRRPRTLIVFSLAFLATAALVTIPLLPEGGFRELYDRSLGYQASRGSPFSVWGQAPSLHNLQTVSKVFVLGLAALFFFVPKRRSTVQVAALAAALLIAVQVTANHWFYPYVVWFAPLVLVALFAQRRGPELAIPAR